MRTAKKKNVQFHIQSDDYFATLATVLDLTRQELEKIAKELIEASQQLTLLRDDLMFLQKNYKIIKKSAGS